MKSSGPNRPGMKEHQKTMGEKARSYKMLWGALIIMAGLNIWLLAGAHSLQQQMNVLQAELVHKGESFPVIREPVRLAALAEDARWDFPLFLIAVFTDYGCVHCVREEVAWLNMWNVDYHNTLRVYYLGSTEGYLERFGAEFVYQPIESVDDLLNIPLSAANPMTMVVDENHFVQLIHTNDTDRPGSDRRRDLFYEQAQSLFQSVYSR